MSDSPVASIPGLPMGSDQGQSLYWDATVGSGVWLPTSAFKIEDTATGTVVVEGITPRLRLFDSDAIDDSDVNVAMVFRNAADTGNVSSIAYFNNALTIANPEGRIVLTPNTNLILNNVPTSDAGLPSGAVWSDAGTLKIAP